MPSRRVGSTQQRTVKYRHSFHAGNFADVFKHVILLEILQALCRKETAFFVLDTHAGEGAYELAPPQSQPAPEYGDGVSRVLAAADHPALRAYVELIRKLGAAPDRDGLALYPGSPLIIATRLRAQDRAVLFELRAAAAGVLERRMHAYGNVSVHRQDGYAALRSQLPPRERRGLVLIDPPYESPPEEFALVERALGEGHRRWATGVYAIWYPIKRREPVDAFQARLKAGGMRKILCAELTLFPPDSRVSLNGCGMIIVNPPFQLESSLREALPALHSALGGRTGSRGACFWLVPE